MINIIKIIGILFLSLLLSSNSYAGWFDKFKIKIVTDDYTIVSDPTGDVQFDLKNKAYITSIYGVQIQQICKFN